MNKILLKRKITITLLLLGVNLVAFAQGPPPPPATPIDGGLAILLAVIGGYAIKKVFDKYKKG
jgi:hypothetical protein